MRRPAPRPLSGRIEPLEDRVTPATLFGLTNANVLLTFDSATPGTIADSDTITGLQAGELIVGIDVRPATGQLYALGLVDDGATRTARIYTLNPTTGAATQVGSTPWTTTYLDTQFGGFNFNPNVDLIRVIADSGQNFRVSPVTGALVGTDTNTSNTGLNGVAYTNNDGFAQTTTLFGLNFSTDDLVTVGGLNGTPSPNGGQVTNVGDTGFIAQFAYGMEIVSVGGVATAFATARQAGTTNLYTVNLTTGVLTSVGAIGGNPAILSLTASLTSRTVGGTGGNDTLVVNATNGNSGSYTLNGGTPVAFSGITSFSFLGGNGDDTLTINNPVGDMFAPTGGIVFHGGAGTANTLVNAGGSSAGGSLTATSATDGTLTQAGPSTQTVTFTGLAAVTDTAGNGGFVVNATAAADTINVVNGPAGRLQVNSGATPTFVTVNVAGKQVVAVEAGGGSNTVTLNFTQAAGVGFLFVIGGPVADTFIVQSTALPTELQGEDGADTFDIVPTAFPVTVNGGPGTDELNNDLTGATDPFFTIAADPAGGLMGGITFSNRGTQTFAQVEPAPILFNFLTVTASDGLTTTPVGSAVTYTVVVRNNSPIGITGIAASATFPTQLTGVTWTAAYTGTGSSGAAGGTGNIAQAVNLAAGGTVTYTVTGTLDPAFTGIITAVASAATPMPADLLDTTPADNTATDTTAVDSPTPLVVTGPGGGTGLRFTSTGGQYGSPQSVSLFPGFGGEIHVAQGDLDGDGVLDIVAATGAGAGLVKVLRGTDQSVLTQFSLFDGYAGGLFVAVGDLDGDGTDDIAVTPDATDAFTGPTNRELPVRVFSGAGFTLLAAFNGLADLQGASGENEGTRLGGRPAIADVNGDGRNDLLIAAGNGGGPRITIWNGTGFAGAAGGKPTTTPLANLFVFESSQRGGAFIAAGDVSGDGVADVIAGGGPGGGPRVRVVSGAKLFGLSNLDVNLDDPANLANGLVLNNFFAGDLNRRGGLRVAVVDLDADGRADLVTGSGTGEASSVRVYSGPALAAAFGTSSEPGVNQVLDPFSAGVPGGVWVG
ncbi:DUF4394 domain-containing protein [Urbifossiella limnaea]|uniref:FG-GAP repeat protein n=1 Tax=Urbifossiella limnaea TaxID=2528023 RepID=A0A517XQ58_9BACT|nr:DUF4394 domain-containing protein [Urbifossiella limnaea]QDU19647.1 FG-GAP repeat protein [Urbifossiella limnaea]